jgi:hypothetical protein
MRDLTRFVLVTLATDYPDAWFQRQHAIGYQEKVLAQADPEGNPVWQVYFPDLGTTANVAEPHLVRLCTLALVKVTYNEATQIYSHTLILDAVNLAQREAYAARVMDAVKAHWSPVTATALPSGESQMVIGLWATRDLTRYLISTKGA